MITRQQLLDKWFNFYTSKGHKRIPSASVIPENDPSVLFTTAGMHPLVPYLLGQPHPMGKRLCDVQKCIRTNDIDAVGDICHLTFFEMLGNWSLGDYFKKEMIGMSFEFLTKELGLDKERLAFTVFEGNELVPMDQVAYSSWIDCGVSPDRIAKLPAEDNWWPSMELPGPCGSDSEMFYWVDNTTPAPKVFDPEDKRWVEIWNDVFMEFNHVGDKFIPLEQKNIDTGMGLERALVTLNHVSSVFATELFSGAIGIIERLSGKTYNDNEESETTRSFRIIADHIRTSTAILGDEKGVVPSNVDAGYVLRRLIRRAIRHCKSLDIPAGHLGDIAEEYINFFKGDYPEFEKNHDRIINELNKEEDKFLHTLDAGEREFKKVIAGIERKREFMLKSDPNAVVENEINGKSAFRLYDTFGFPIELTVEMAKEYNYSVDVDGFNKAYEEHKELARTTSAGKFKGGLSDNSEINVRYHTATHLMLCSLQALIDPKIIQKGCNITAERVRFDFSFDRKLTDEEVKAVEDRVNKAIAENIDVIREEMPIEDARKKGAMGIFDNKYGEIVSVYTIPNYSCEICGGPHVENTGKIGKFKIVKQEASSAGVRRIKAIIE